MITCGFLWGVAVFCAILCSGERWSGAAYGWAVPPSCSYPACWPWSAARSIPYVCARPCWPDSSRSPVPSLQFACATGCPGWWARPGGSLRLGQPWHSGGCDRHSARTWCPPHYSQSFGNQWPPVSPGMGQSSWFSHYERFMNTRFPLDWPKKNWSHVQYVSLGLLQHRPSQD